MANDSTSTKHLWVLDSVGFLWAGTVYVKKIIFIPNAADDDVLFNTWDETVAPVTDGFRYATVTGTITSNSVLTVGGTNLPAAIADGYIFRILTSTGAAANVDRHVVETAGNNTAITVHHEDDNWTNEATKLYTWETYKTTTAIVLKAGASDASPIHVDYGPRGRKFRNLCLETLTGGTVYVELSRSINA